MLYDVKYICCISKDWVYTEKMLDELFGVMHAHNRFHLTKGETEYVPKENTLSKRMGKVC